MYNFVEVMRDVILVLSFFDWFENINNKLWFM